MSHEDYRRYFTRRADMEMDAATRAVSDGTRRLHEEMAALLRARADAPSSVPGMTA